MPSGPVNRDRMALPLLPPAYDKRRVERRPRTADHGTEATDMALGAAGTPGGSGLSPGSSMYAGHSRQSGVIGAPQSTAWCADDSQGSDTDLEDEGFRSASRDVHLDSTRGMYNAACRRYGVLPSSQVLACIATETVDLANRNLSPKDATALACALLNNTDVTTLSLRGNRIGAVGIRSVCGMMDENVYITSLDLSDNRLGRPGAAEIGAMLKVNEELRVLRLAGNNFQEKDAVLIADALQNNFRLAELDLSNNNLQQEGGASIGQALTTTDTLLKLDLSWNHLRLRGALALAAGLQNNASLTHLNLSWNGFADAGARAICDALKENTTLIDLDLTSNRITAIGAASLGKAISVNNTLQVLRLGLNQLTTVGAIKVLEALRRNETSSLKLLDMKEVSVTLEFEALVNEIKKSRDINISRGVIISTHDHLAMLLASQPPDIIISDPIHEFMVHVKLKKIRLFDSLVQFDEQITTKIDRSQFLKAVRLAGISMKAPQLDAVLESLDPKNEDCIDYGLLLNLEADPIVKARKQIALAKSRNAFAKTQRRNSSGRACKQSNLIRPVTGGQPLETRVSRPSTPVRPNTSVSAVQPPSSPVPAAESSVEPPT